MITVEFTASIDSVGTLKTFYLSTEQLITESTDTPANTAFETRLLDPASIGIHVFSDGKTGGKSALETGEIIIANIDGALDYLLDYSVDGRNVIIREGAAISAYPSSFNVIFNGTMDGIEADNQKIIIRLRDKSYLLDKPLSTNKYLGNNALPNGLEGVESDLKGERKPLIFGNVFNYSLIQVNTSRLIYQCNNGAVLDIPGVYDKGVLLTRGIDYTSQSDMETNAPIIGGYRAWLGGGYVRLGSKPAGLITADITQTIKTTAQVMQAIAQLAGITNISASDVTALDTANSASVGLVVRDQTALDALDSIAQSIGAYFYFDKLGAFRLGQLTAPSIAPISTFYDYDIISIERRPSKDVNIPAFSVSIDYANNETVQTTLAGSVTQDRVSWLSLQKRTTTSEDLTIKNQFLLARDISFQTRLVNAVDANNEALMRLNLYKIRRDIYDVTIPSYIFNFELMNTINVFYNRFNLSSGKNFRIIGIAINSINKQVILSLWG